MYIQTSLAFLSLLAMKMLQDRSNGINEILTLPQDSLIICQETGTLPWQLLEWQNQSYANFLY